MIKKILLYFLLITSTSLLAVSYIALAKESKQSALKLIVKNSSEIKEVADVKAVMKKLTALASNLEKTAKLYDTINQQVYWESEAKASFLKLLHGEGYYDSFIETEFPENQNSIIFYINGFARYRVKKIQIEYTENSNHNINLPDLTKLKIKKGDFAVASKIIETQAILAKEIESNNCLLSLKVAHEATIDNSDNTISLKFIIEAGPHARVRSVNVKGLSTIDPEYVKKVIPIKPGQCFRSSMIKESQGELQKTGLFGITTPEIPNTTDENGLVPVMFDLQERKYRSIKAGINYSTDLGLGIKTGLIHRNLLGSGEVLKADIFGNQKEQTFDLEFTKPFFRRDDQILKIGVSGENTISKAFENREGAVSAGIERKLNRFWTVGAGGKYSYSIVKEIPKVKRARNFPFVSTPLFIKFDKKDNILNPHKGYEVVLKAEPFYSVKQKGHSFFKDEFIAHKYFSYKSKIEPVIALRATVGSIRGAKVAQVPANEKFYVGGAQSVRGYGDQLAGDLNASRRPVGGRSFVEATAEFRTRIKDNMGVVVFFDTGRSFSEMTPSFKKRMFSGVGIGARYFTDFGPLRFDIAFPLKRRNHKVDKAFQIYFGIGQNF